MESALINREAGGERRARSGMRRLAAAIAADYKG